MDGQVAILDDFSSSIVEVMDSIGSLGHGKPDLVVGDVVDSGTLDEVFPRFNMGL